MRDLTCLLLPLLVGLTSCVGDIGDTDAEPEVPGPPAVEPQQVPQQLEVLPSTATCVPRLAGEQLLSVSPEGHAWLVDAGSPVNVRVLDAFDGEISEQLDELEIDGLREAQAWSGADAALIADQGLFRLEDFARIELSPPSGFANPASLCGDPSDNGVLLSGGKVFERRGDEWWSWSPDAQGDGAPQAVVRYDGECRSSSDAMWLGAADGTLFRVAGSQFTRPVRFASLVDVAGTEGMLAVLESDRLWIGPDAWQAWVFPGRVVPSQLTASNGLLWMTAGSELLRFDGTTWVSIEHALTEPIERVAAHAGGAWLIGAETICHQGFGPTVRVEGVRPFGRHMATEYELRVRASDGDADLVADVDGTPIELTLDAESGWLSGTARLETVGWHTIAFASSDASARRDVHVKRMPEVERSWASDIEPIYQANCSSSSCHRAGSTDPPDLGSLSAWTERADEIRTRVVQAKTMPPAANVEPDWGSDDIEIIQEWLEGGMLP